MISFTSSLPNAKIFLFGLFASLIANACSNSEGCGCILKNEDKVQRNLLKNLLNHTLCGKRFQFKDENSYEFTFVLCEDVKKEDYPYVSLISKDLVQDKIFPLGYRNYTSVTGLTGHGAWTMLTLNPPAKSNENNSTKCQNYSSVMILCDKDYPNGQFKLGYIDEELCHYVFELRTSEICDEYSGLSGFSIFLIILLVAFAMYFIVGICYKRSQPGVKGIDQIPHRHFWFGLGNKFADCCSTVCRCDQYCSDGEHLDSQSQYTGGYSPIGETIGTQPGMSASPIYERDSQLIKP